MKFESYLYFHYTNQIELSWLSERTLDDIIKTSKQDLKMDEPTHNHTLAKNGSVQIAVQEHTKLTFELASTDVILCN